LSVNWWLPLPSDEETPLWFRKVYGGQQKYENFIDKLFGIKNSSEHTWHYSIGENLTNVIGFTLGKIIHKNFARV
jgi:hypothetical protein